MFLVLLFSCSLVLLFSCSLVLLFSLLARWGAERGVGAQAVVRSAAGALTTCRELQKNDIPRNASDCPMSGKVIVTSPYGLTRSLHEDKCLIELVRSGDVQAFVKYLEEVRGEADPHVQDGRSHLDVYELPVGAIGYVETQCCGDAWIIPVMQEDLFGARGSM